MSSRISITHKFLPTIKSRLASPHIRRAFLLASLSVFYCAGALQHLWSQTYDLTAVVLINSTNTTGYNTDPANPGEYQRYPERYLEHLQIPYRIIDVSSSSAQDLTGTQLIIAGHKGLSLTPDWQQAIISAVTGGTGFVNLDSDPGIGTNAHIQAIFGATGSVLGSQTGYAIHIPATVMPDGATPHYIAAMQIRFPSTPAGDLVYSFHYNDSNVLNGVVPTILQGAQGTVIAKLDTNDTLVLATTYKAGRAVDFSSYDYMRPDRFGFMMGLDDLFWRSLVWAARKPFVVRGYPRFFALQMDDLDGGFMSRLPDVYNSSFTGNVQPDGTGGPWKPTGNFGMNDIGADPRAPYISAVESGLIELSPHAIELENTGGDFYWDMTVPNTDAQWVTSLNSMLTFKAGQGGSDTIPAFSRSMVPHYGDLSNNAGYDMWNSLGQRYISTEQAPGAYYFLTCKTGTQRMMLRPYRIYELPPSGCDPDEEYPIYYADDLVVGSRAGLPSQTFFAFATWPPTSEIWPQYSNWTEAQSLESFERHTWLFWSGLAPYDVYTHDLGNYEAAPVAARQQLITQLSAWMGTYGVRQVFMQDLGDYFYARNKSTLVSASSTPGNISLTFTGTSATADGVPVQTMALVFNGDNEGTWANIPSFTNGATVQVGNVQLTSISVTPSSVSIPKGETQQFTATGTYSDGSTENITSVVSWTSTNTSVATISGIGLASGTSTGSTTIQAALGGVTGSTGLTVTSPALVSIAVTPANASIQTGATQQFMATGTYSDGSTQNLTSSVTWTSLNTAAATITSTGLATGVAVGNTTIQAGSGTIIGGTNLTVTLTLVSIAVTPINVSIPAGTMQQFIATGTYSDGSTQNVTAAVTWSSANTAVATITSAGLATGLAVGGTTIQAVSGSVSGSTNLTVTTPVLTSIVVTPANPSVPAGSSVQLSATGIYSDGSQQSLTSAASWTSSNTAVATVSSSGLVSGVSGGTATIQAAQGVIAGSTGVTVTATIPGLVAYWTFDDGTGTTAADSSGNNYNATLVNGVSWVAGKIGDAVSANGTSQYVSVPAINLSSTNAVTVTMWVNRSYSTVGNHTLFENSSNFNSSTTGFGVFPDDSTCGGIMVGVHGNVGYSINCYSQPSSAVWHHLAFIFDKSQAGNAQTALYVDGVLQTPTKNYLTSKNTNDFGSNASYVFARGGTQEFAAGSVDDLRVYSRALSASEIQQIYSFNGATLTGITVTPANASIAKGATQQYIATGKYSDGSQQNLTNSVAWTSSSTTVASITSAGLATAVGTGNTTIQATSGAISSSTGLTVTPATLVSIAIAPSNPSIVNGATQQFTATGTYSDGTQQGLTSSATWSSSNTGVATITSTGLATSVGAGSTTIQATSGSINGSTVLTVTKTLVSIAVTPSNPSIGKGGTQQFTATGTYSDGTQQNLSSSVTWTSSNTAVATINNAGLATSVAAGSTTIAATSGSISGSTLLTVMPPSLVSIAVTPANPSLVVGGTQQFTATGTYSDGSQQGLTSSVTWSSSNTAAATISSSGLASGVAAGNATIQAMLGVVGGSTGLTVTTQLAGLVGYWTFDEGSGTTAGDSSGNGYNMTLSGGVTWTTGVSGDAISASGSKQYGKTVAVNLTSTKAVTVTLWVNRTYSTAGGHTLFEDSANFNNSTTGFGFYPDDNTCLGMMVGEHGNVGYNINCYKQPSSGVWHHVAVIYDKSQPAAGEVTLYVDGSLQTPTQNYMASDNTNAFGSNVLYVFSRGGSSEFTSGMMDDLRIYNRALSASEIQQIYNSK